MFSQEIIGKERILSESCEERNTLPARNDPSLVMQKL